MASRHDAPRFARLVAHPLRWRLVTELARSDRRVRELVAAVDEPQNLVSYHLRLLRDGGFVARQRSSYDGRDAYYHLDLDRCAEGLEVTAAAIHPSLASGVQMLAAPAEPVSVLFVCTGNSARSPMAEALLRQGAPAGVTVASAGTHPRPTMHPKAVRALREQFRIDIGSQHPRNVDAFAEHPFDHIVTVCDNARESLPSFPGHPTRVHWSVPDLLEDADQATFDGVAANIAARIQRRRVALMAPSN